MQNNWDIQQKIKYLQIVTIHHNKTESHRWPEAKLNLFLSFAVQKITFVMLARLAAMEGTACRPLQKF